MTLRRLPAPGPSGATARDERQIHRAWKAGVTERRGLNIC